MFTKKQTSSAQKHILKGCTQFKGFEILRLKDFLKKYNEDLSKQNLPFNMKRVNYNSPYEIFCLTDCREGTLHSMNKEIKQKYRKVNTKRRIRMKKQYLYSNTFNRIHGYLMVEDVSNSEKIPEEKKVLSLSLICASSYSDKRGIGSCLMNFLKKICEKSDFTDIILEVANEHASNYVSDEEEEYYDSDDDGDYEEASYREIFNDPFINYLTDEFYRKSLRHRIGENGEKEAYYNVGDEYINGILYSYINDIHGYEKYDFDEVSEEDKKNPDADQYGGYYYTKGKLSQKGLFQFYQKFGFKEMPDIHYKWQIYTTDPYPTMILNL